MTENISESDPELFVGKPVRFVRPPQVWLDSVSPETRAAIDELEKAATALEAIDDEIVAAQARIVECANVLRTAQDYEHAHGGPMTQTQLAKDFIASQRA